MAEGLLNARFPDRFQAYSAGTERTIVKPHAIAALAQIGIDISHHTSEHIEKYIGQEFDLVVTVCDSAREACPFFPGAVRTIHKAFTDPSSDGVTDEEKLAAFGRVRDEIDAWIRESFGDDGALT